MFFGPGKSIGAGAGIAAGMLLVAAMAVPARTAIEEVDPPAYGPYHARFLSGGEGISEQMRAGEPMIAATAHWTLHTWVRIPWLDAGEVLLGGFGEPGGASARFLGLHDGRPALVLGGVEPIRARTKLPADAWHFLAATFDGAEARLYVNGRIAASRRMTLPAGSAVVHLAPLPAGRGQSHFGGELASFQLHARALAAAVIGKLHARRPAFELINFAQISVGWPWQVRQQAGLALPQSPATLPRSAAPFSAPRAVPVVEGPALQAADSDAQARVVGGWYLAAAPKVGADGEVVSRQGFATTGWYPATVPGTVLTTLIDRGVYPDPDHGLNNLAIPESLNRQAYWYRTQFEAPADLAGRTLSLDFKGINYHADVWLNGERLGEIRGAFIRGRFDVTGRLHPGRTNAIAVRVRPPPHPGIPHEQSRRAGPGENGGALALDGPTFIATEGWDWMPAIRDRNTGIWQEVLLSATGPVRIGDVHVVTRLPLPATDRARVEITVPLENFGGAPLRGTLRASFDPVSIAKEVTLAPGATIVKLAPGEFAQLALEKPRLWWPNGYGKPELYELKLAFTLDGRDSDTRALRFGIRHITYELSLFDDAGRLRRVEVDPALASARGERLVDVRHEALKKSPRGWAASLYPEALGSPAVRLLEDDSLTPHLAIKVNGVRIAARGGNWGMDDSRKRISRERLEPYFRLHAEANLNTIRNWVGLNTEDVFFELADEYGLLVFSDFWASTQDFQVEPEDAALFLANARDVIRRYRNHPSIALWFGRNEGVLQPVLNSGLADLVAELDGTRHFTGSSNRVNLQGSGPYNYRPPAQYFTELAQGFSVEVGTPSLATLESIRAWTPAADLWPISDTLAYHDWHHGGNGDVATFMATLEEQFGAPSSLEDFERKAQMMNYVTHRAMFEGFHAHLWTKNSGRLLWMTHPAWPSHSWQIYSSDYDTHASYYGVRKACEPVHVQMDLPGFRLAVVNTTREARKRLTLHARVFSLDHRLLQERRDLVDAAANATTAAAPLDLSRDLAAQGVVLVKLDLVDERGTRVSENLYWQARDAAAHRRLLALPAGTVTAAAFLQEEGEQARVLVTLRNATGAAQLAIKLTLLDAQGARILPAYYSDNYMSLLPGDERTVEIAIPAGAARAAGVAVRGWNTRPTHVAVRPGPPGPAGGHKTTRNKN